MSSIELIKLCKRFDSTEVLTDITLHFAAGEFIVIVGPSGCGKSTLLRLISGLEDISSGELRIAGERMNDVLPAKRGIAMVFQSYALYPHMTVYENMAFGLEQARLGKQQIRERVLEAAELLQIGELLERKPRQLSGGQRQRVAIGRAITRQPRVFLFDEPLSNLDAALRVDTRIELAHLHQRLDQTTMVYVTHDQVEAMTLADRIVVLNDGRVEQVGTPMDLYRRPATRFVATFIGSPRMNVIEGRIAAEHDVHAYGIRPEHLAIATDSGRWRGRVLLSEELGSDTFVHVDTDEAGLMNARVVGFEHYHSGQTVYLTPAPGAEHLFDDTGRAMTP